MSKILKTLCIAVVGVLAAASSQAQDAIRVAGPHPTALTTITARVAQELGFFEKENLVVDMLWTQGGSDVLQAVISGSVDIGIETGLGGVLSAIEKGAPIEVISSQMTGAGEFYWYVKADSDIQSFADLQDGETVSFSRPGASSETILNALLAQSGAKATPVSSGSPPETLTQVMSGQIDVGWGAPPAYPEIKDGRLRIIGRGNDATVLAGQTTRVNVANAAYLEANKDTVRRFLRAMNATLDALYTDPEVLAKAAEFVKLDVADARSVLTDFVPREAFTMNKLGDLEGSMQQAVENKQLSAPLSAEAQEKINKNIADLAP
ncbi:ABC transporter substrate-binding protein [Aquibium sp. LZ166]|uniref:ABC transporter substrate-binding protein n=1 Tax=Aquibium pacificus TaxID=3153579 RepID=A0ABV3SI26_9HYPH